MGIITTMRRQIAVYWSLTPNDVKYDRYGQPIPIITPVEIKCRWEDVQEEFIDSEGTKRLSRSVVYVDRIVDIAGSLFLGLLTDLTDPEVPSDNPGAFEIIQFTQLPNLRNTETLLTAFL